MCGVSGLPDDASGANAAGDPSPKLRKFRLGIFQGYTPNTPLRLVKKVTVYFDGEQHWGRPELEDKITELMNNPLFRRSNRVFFGYRLVEIIGDMERFVLLAECKKRYYMGENEDQVVVNSRWLI